MLQIKFCVKNKMNKIDKEWYECLKALSKIPRDNNLDKFMTENIKNIKSYMEGTTWNELHTLGHVTSNPSVKNIVTPSGLEQLRMLEDIRRKDLTLIASVVAVVISLVALGISFVPFAKSMGWI